MGHGGEIPLRYSTELINISLEEFYTREKIRNNLQTI